MNPRLCIFCGTPLTRETKPEHILQDALGGKSMSKVLDCSDCNSTFGSTIDKALAEEIRPIRNMCHMPSGNGEPPPAVRHDSIAGRIVYGAGGRPRLIEKPFTLTKADGVVTIAIRAGSAEQFVASLKHAAAQLRVPVAELWEKVKAGPTEVVERFEPLPTEPRRQSLGGELSVRAMAKSCLLLAAKHLGNEAVRGPAFAEARNFVTNGDLGDSGGVTLDSRPVPFSDALEARFGPLFNLIQVATDSRGRLLAHFTLYNVIGWQIVLAEEGAPAGFCTALASNPLKPQIWSDKIAEELGVDTAWLETPNFNSGDGVRRFGRMWVVSDDLAREREVGRIVESAFARHGIVGDVVVDNDAIKDQVFAEIHGRMAAMIVRVPYERVISLDEIEALLSESDVGDQA
ncbi:HNH endonuclease [Caulobacter sp. NIBR1757]|uniref:HNH endonuclease n=1 Tax=Caulobacter sp. NIBR1757 TaxID=3016000 RepID=UPI0022F0705A|nr:HNH endonuclease [Caulobacter sp. NIBR1757]WGM40784.1 hypothetical protein AMEJIAPC_03731 [Caulobacter sp. NIBR1757]